MEKLYLYEFINNLACSELKQTFEFSRKQGKQGREDYDDLGNISD